MEGTAGKDSQARANELAGHLSQVIHDGIYDSHILHPPRDWDWADDDEMKELGEDPGDVDCPLIFARDGEQGREFAEVEIEVTAWPTSVESRKQFRDQLANARTYIKKIQERKQ